jgi:hypothetical protein
LVREAVKNICPTQPTTVNCIYEHNRTAYLFRFVRLK